MPKEKAKAKAAAVEVDETAIDFEKYRDKAPTDLQERFAAWILEKVDPAPKDEDGDEVELDLPSFTEGVRLGVALRMVFQASPENQEILEERRAKAAEPKEDKPAAKRGPKPKAKADPDPEPDEDEEDEDDDEPEEKPKPKMKAKRASAAAIPATAVKAGKPAAKVKAKKSAAAAVGDDAPF